MVDFACRNEITKAKRDTIKFKGFEKYGELKNWSLKFLWRVESGGEKKKLHG